jgi:hypothetical protein
MPAPIFLETDLYDPLAVGLAILLFRRLAPPKSQ